MSHITKIAVKLKIKDAIVQAGKKLGLVVEENSFVRGWGSQRVKADVVLRMQPYDVGFVQATDGSYDAVGDFDMGAGRQLGEGLLVLRNEYAVQACLMEAQRAGMLASVKYTNEETHEAEIILTEVQA